MKKQNESGTALLYEIGDFVRNKLTPILATAELIVWDIEKKPNASKFSELLKMTDQVKKHVEDLRYPEKFLDSVKNPSLENEASLKEIGDLMREKTAGLVEILEKINEEYAPSPTLIKIYKDGHALSLKNISLFEKMETIAEYVGDMEWREKN